MALIWNERNTRRLLDFISDEQKQQNRWSEKRRDPTKHGWDNIFRRFSETRHGGRSKKDNAISMQHMKNHWTQLKTSYYDWSKGLRVTGDPDTGEIAYDRVLQAARDRVKSESRHPIPLCCEQLHIILGCTPRHRGGVLESAGGGYTSIDGSAVAGRSNKRPSNVIDSEPVQNTIRSVDRAAELEHKEILQVHKLLKEDGVSEGDEYFGMSNFYVRDRLQRYMFLSTKTKEGRRNVVSFYIKMKKMGVETSCT